MAEGADAQVKDEALTGWPSKYYKSWRPKQNFNKYNDSI